GEVLADWLEAGRRRERAGRFTPRRRAVRSRLLSQHAEPVVGVPERRRQAAPGGGRRPPDAVAPRPAAARAPLAFLRTPRVALGRAGVIVASVPVGAPLVDDRAHVEQAETVRLSRAHRPG